MTEQLKYDDMLSLPHHVSEKHPQMSVYDRAAQFAPFAALTGYEDAVVESARLTEDKVELDEMEKSLLDEKLQEIQLCIQQYMQQKIRCLPKVSITYFQPDEKKDGGRYVTIEGTPKKLDSYEKMIVLQDGSRIPIEDITQIEL